jgi:uncharacterized membrane protein YdjX (TVP38/TMEM64 family)
VTAECLRSGSETLACAVSRFMLRDWVQGRFGDKLATINAGIEREGAFNLFSLRLVPVFPFFVINLLMGAHPHAAVDLFLGVADRHAGRDRGLCQCRQAKGEPDVR